MNTEALQSQQLQLLARKALLTEDIKQIDAALGQISAVLQFAAAQPVPAPAEPAPAE